MASAFWQTSGNAGSWNADQAFGGLGTSGYLAAAGGATYIQEAGTIDHLTVQVDQNDRTFGISVSIQGGTGSLSLTVPAGTTGTFQDLAGSITVAAGSLIYVRAHVLDPSPDPANFYSLQAVSVRFTATDPTKTVSRFTANTPPNVVTLPYIALIGQVDNVIDEAQVTFHAGKGGQAGTLSHASIRVILNTRAVATTIVLRKNGASTALTVTIPAGATGWFHNTTTTLTIDGFDRINWLDAQSGASGALWIETMHVDYITANSMWSGGLGQSVRNLSGNTTTDLAIGGVNNIPGPQTMPMAGIIGSLGIYFDARFLTTDSTLTLVINGVASTSLVVTIPAGGLGYFYIHGSETFAAGDELLLRLELGDDGPASYFCIDFASIPTALNPEITGVIGPLVWDHWTEFIPGGSPDTETETYSDQDMQCPEGYENGFKEGITESYGDGERALSHPWSGEWTGAFFRIRRSDFDLRWRQRLAGLQRFMTQSCVVKMTTRANRAVLGEPYTVFVGPPVDVQAVSRVSLDVTLGDIISQALLSDEHQVPWRMIRDGFLSELDEVYEHLDQETPEPIIYGQHRRVPDVDPASPCGFLFAPIYLGVEAGERVWMTAGHACAEYTDLMLDDGETLTSVFADAGITWRVPGIAGEPKYEDRRSSTFGNMRRYSLIRCPVGDPDGDACAAGEKTLLVAVDGKERNGDGSGPVITDGFEQYKDFAVNYLANFGQNSQHTDPLTSPTWDVFGTPVPIIDEDSFDTCSGIALSRLGGGYVGAVIIGARAGDRASVRRWIADFNRSLGVRNGITHLGQYRVVMLHPTEAIKASAPLYTDATEILEGSFDVSLGWRDHANRIPARGDYEYRTGVWKTTLVATDGLSVTSYGREITSEQREYPCIPGITLINHLATLEVRQRRHPPRTVVLEDTVGPDAVGSSLGYLDLGDYIRYRHFAGIGNSRSEIRLGWITKHQVQAGKRRVRVELLDVEDLIDFDVPDVAEATSPVNDTCASAIDIDGTPDMSYVVVLDTTLHQTDLSLSVGSPSLMPVPPASNAAWFTITPAATGTLFLTTANSEYDTQMAVLTGTCGSSPVDWVLVDSNDNDGLLFTSILEIPVTMGVEYHIVIAGVGSPSGGILRFGALVSVP